MDDSRPVDECRFDEAFREAWPAVFRFATAWTRFASRSRQTPLDILGVWAFHSRGQEPGPSRGRSHRAIEHYRPGLERRGAAVIGDFNDNVQWDTPSYPSFARTVEMFEGWLSAITQFDVGDTGWLAWSDHVPLLLELSI
jgi:hypothetical protein